VNKIDVTFPLQFARAAKDKHDSMFPSLKQSYNESNIHAYCSQDWSIHKYKIIGPTSPLETIAN
jgi:hypothetical protein